MDKPWNLCPFSNRPLHIYEIAEGHWIASSPYGWKTRLHPSKESVEEWLQTRLTDTKTWAESDPLADPYNVGLEIEIKVEGMNPRVFFRVYGNGWFSESQQTKYGIYHWLAMRHGEVIQQHIPPRVQVISEPIDRLMPGEEDVTKGLVAPVSDEEMDDTGAF